MITDYSNEKSLLAALRRRDDAAYKYLEDQYFQMAEQIVLSRNGNKQDAEDIFNEGMLCIVEKVRQRKLDDSAKIKTYLYDIWLKMWLNELRRRGTIEKNEEEIEEVDDWVPDETLERNVYRQIAWDCFEKLERNCRTIIMNIRQGMKHSIIAQRLKRSEGYIKKRSHLCHQEWLRLVRMHPGYLEANKTDTDQE